MRPPKYTYTVTDIETGKIILKDCSNQDMKIAIGIPAEKISAYVTNGYLWRSRYKIQHNEIYRPKPEPKPVYMDKTYNSSDIAFMKLFNNAMANLKKNYPPERLKLIVFVEKAERVS